VLHPQPVVATEDGQLPATAQRVLALLLAELPLKTAVRLATDITQQPKNVLYQAALAWKQATESDDTDREP